MSNSLTYTRLQELVQSESNAQMNKMLQGVRNRQ